MRATCKLCGKAVHRYKSLAGVYVDCDPGEQILKKKKSERRFVVVEGYLLDTSHHPGAEVVVPHIRNCEKRPKSGPALPETGVP